VFKTNPLQPRPIDQVKDAKIPTAGVLPGFAGQYKWLIIVGLILLLLWAAGGSSQEFLKV
jgi:hypothetical protein